MNRIAKFILAGRTVEQFFKDSNNELRKLPDLDLYTYDVRGRDGVANGLMYPVRKDLVKSGKSEV